MGKDYSAPFSRLNFNEELSDLRREYRLHFKSLHGRRRLIDFANSLAALYYGALPPEADPPENTYLGRRISVTQAQGIGTHNCVTLDLHLGPHDTARLIEPVLEAVVHSRWFKPADLDSWDDIGRKTWRFEQRSDSPLGACTLLVRVFVEHSRACRRVQVGTQPKYEIVCDDDAESRATPTEVEPGGEGDKSDIPF